MSISSTGSLLTEAARLGAGSTLGSAAAWLVDACAASGVSRSAGALWEATALSTLASSWLMFMLMRCSLS